MGLKMKSPKTKKAKEARGRKKLDHVRLHVSIDADLAAQLRARAESESRMVSKQIETFIRDGLARA